MLRTAHIIRQNSLSVSQTVSRHVAYTALTRQSVSRAFSSTAPPRESEYFQSMGQVLSRNAPRFAVSSRDVSVIQSPSEFYDTLLNMISTSTKRISLASLYLGNSPMEQRLLDAIQKQCREHPQLRVDFTMDYYRGQRKGRPHPPIPASFTQAHEQSEAPAAAAAAADSTEANTAHSQQASTESEMKSSAAMIAPLMAHFPGQVSLNLVRAYNPMSWKGLAFGKYQELFGVFHMKAYMFDDTLIVSGANLSDLYFTHRQDRYMMVHNAGKLIQFYGRLISLLVNSPLGCSVTPSSDGSRYSIRRCPAVSRWVSNDALQDVNVEVRQMMGPAALDEDDLSFSSTADHDTWIFPTVQVPIAGVAHDEAVTSEFLHWLNHARSIGRPPQYSTALALPDPATSSSFVMTAAPAPSPSSSTHPLRRFLLDLSTGYMNITPAYNDLLLALLPPPERINPRSIRAITTLMAASKEANGWAGAKGPSKFVPDVYDDIMRCFVNQVESIELRFLLRQKRAAWVHGAGQLKVLEYSRPEWTYHAKGLWLTLPDEDSPRITAIGSSNFGRRSVQCDIESQLFIMTTSPDLAEQLKVERDSVQKYCHERTFHQRVKLDTTDRIVAWLKSRPHAWFIHLLAVLGKRFI